MAQKKALLPTPILHAPLWRHLAAPLCMLLFCATLAAQARVREVNLAYLTRRADVIVQGRVTRVQHGGLPQYPNLATIEVTLSVEDMVRGSAQKTYTFREILVGLRSREGKENYRVGQQMLLFLPAPSKLGLSSPIGMEQGRFHIAGNAATSAMIINETGNIGLFKDVAPTAARAGRKLSASQLKVAATRRGAVRLDDFKSLVKNLTALSRIQ